MTNKQIKEPLLSPRPSSPLQLSSSELVTSKALPLIDARIYVVINAATYMGVIAHALYVPLFYLAGFPLLGFLNVGSVLFWLLARYMNQRHRQGVAVLLLATEVVAHALICVALLGWGSGFQYYLFPLVSFVLYYSRGATFVVWGTAISLLGVLLALHFFSEVGNRLPPPFDSFFEVANLVVPFLTSGLLSFYYRQASFSAEVRMERLATEDPLTGLLNRRRMGERLSQERARTERGAAVFCLAMADIDYFKRVNDSYGHECGDEVLIEISRRLRAGLRSPDIVSRWGGEEFLMLLPDTDAQGAVTVMKRMCHDIAETPIFAGGREISVSLSFGVGAFRSGMLVNDAIRAADFALYEAKAQGRNRVVLWEDPKASGS